MSSGGHHKKALLIWKFTDEMAANKFPVRAKFNLLVYQATKTEYYERTLQKLNFSCGQRLVKCSSHGDFLVRVPVGRGLKCGHSQCNNKCSYRCPHRPEDVAVYCSTSRCMKHMKALLDQNDPVDVANEQSVEDVSVPVESQDDPAGVEDDGACDVVPDEGADHFVEAIEPEDLAEADALVAPIVEALKDELDPGYDLPEPISVVDDGVIRGSFVINQFCKVSARFGCQNSSVATKLQPLLQNAYQRDEHSGAMLYIEADFFPELHPFMEDGVPVGALPHGMYLNPDEQSLRSTFGTLMEHHHIRTHDMTLLSAQNPNSIIWAHDIDLNMRCQHKPMATLFKKGHEAIPQQGINLGSNEMAMRYMTVNDHGPVNELTAMLKKYGNIDYFVTLTCSHETTPGVDVLTEAVKSEAASSKQPGPGWRDIEELNLFTANTPRYVKYWCRTVRWFFTWAMYSDERPLGKIKAYWYRLVLLNCGLLCT